MRARRIALSLLALSFVLWAPGRAIAASDATLSGVGDSHTWEGTTIAPANPVAASGQGVTDDTSGCPSDEVPTCDVELIDVVDPGTPYALAVTIEPNGAATDDWDLYVYDAHGHLVGSSARSATTDGGREVVEVFSPNAGTYSVRVQAFEVGPGASYHGIADLRSASGSTSGYDLFAQDCLEPRPKEIAAPVDLGQRIELDVLILLDGLTEADVAENLAGAAASYGAIGLDVVWTFQSLDVPADGENQGRPTAEGSAVNTFARNALSGRRPAGVDIVYTLSAKDLYTAGSTRDYGLLGVADCIGGVRYHDRAFATGEITSVDGLVIGPTESLAIRGRRTTAHEIAHLLGAHHHYFNCVEGVPSEATDGEISPCTIMAPYVDLQSDNFGQLEAAVIRGHALAYATAGDDTTPTPVVPEIPATASLILFTAVLSGLGVVALRRRPVH